MAPNLRAGFLRLAKPGCYRCRVHTLNAALARVSTHPLGRRIEVVLPVGAVLVVVVCVLRDLYPWPWHP